MTTGFTSFNLPPELQKAINDLGYSSPSPIQDKILPFTLKGFDAIGKAQTGTGKTAAFLITIINDLLSNPISDATRYAGEPRALILAPTRELALQIEQDAKKLLRYSSLKLLSVFGGVDFDKQKQALNDYIDIVVATPGRLLDLSAQKVIWLDQIEHLVIDEADRLLDMGFIPDVKKIVRLTPEKQARQTQLFSATFNQDVLNLSRQWLFDPVTVTIEANKKTSDDVEQRVYVISHDQKLAFVEKILTDEPVEKVIIFANRRDQVRKLYEKLSKTHKKIGMLSGEMTQDKRLKVLRDFKADKLDLLIATDVAGRGLHVEGITHVINFTMPEQADDYIHRIGRTGRAGKKGVSISFACEDDAFQLPAIEAELGHKLPLIYPDI